MIRGRRRAAAAMLAAAALTAAGARAAEIAPLGEPACRLLGASLDRALALAPGFHVRPTAKTVMAPRPGATAVCLLSAFAPGDRLETPARPDLAAAARDLRAALRAAGWTLAPAADPRAKAGPRLARFQARRGAAVCAVALALGPIAPTTRRIDVAALKAAPPSGRLYALHLSCVETR